MSTVLMIQYKDSSRPAKYIPIASSNTFKTYWEPICKELNLEWITLMESAGIIFPKQLEAIPAIIHELETMQTAISNENRLIQDSVRREINSRIHTLISEMQQIQNAPDEIDHASIS